MAEYPSNSNKAKESSLVREQQTSAPQPQTQTDIPQSTHPRAHQQRKISPVREIFKAIFPGGFNQIKEQLLWDIFVPWAQDQLHNGWIELGNVILPGSTKSKPSGNPEHYSYNEAYKPKTYNTSYYEYDMKPFRTQKEADEILNELHEIMMKYGIVTLLDFNDKVGNRTNPTQANYGWTNINAADIRRVRDGWIIEMPKARPIDG